MCVLVIFMYGYIDVIYVSIYILLRGLSLKWIGSF